MPNWKVQRDGAQWLMDKDGRVIGLRDIRGRDWLIPMQQATPAETEAQSDPTPPGGAGSGANLTFNRDATTVTVLSDSGSDAILPAATGAFAGVMAAADKAKLDGIEAGATADMTPTEIVTAINGLLGGTAWQASGATNLTLTRDGTTVNIFSDTGTDVSIQAADGTNAGLLLPAEKTKLAGIAAGATANATDAQLRDRSTHTGTQTFSTISDGTEAVQDIVGALIVGAGGTYDDAGNSITLPGGGSITVQEADTTVSAAVTTLDFGAGFDVTESPAGEANIALDLSEVAPLVVVDATTARTLTAADNNKILVFTSASNVTVTVDTAFNGLSCFIMRAGTGRVTIAASGTTLRGASLSINAQYLGASILPTGTANEFDVIGGTGDVEAAEEDIASAATTTLANTVSSNVNITGTTGITSFGNAPAGTRRWGRFAGALTLTHNATSLILNNGGSNITTAAGDRFYAYTEADNNWVVTVFTASGAPVSGGGGVTVQDEGTPLSTTATTLNFTGAGVTASGTGATKTINIPGAGSATITVKEDGTNVSTAITAIDFLGADFDVTESPAGEANVVISSAIARAANVQPLDSDLTAIAAIAPTNDDIIQRKAGAWTNRTMAQLKTDLAIASGDVSGLSEAIDDRVGAALVLPSGAYDDAGNSIRLPYIMEIAIGDETTAATVGAAKVTFHMPVAMTLAAIHAGATAAPTGADAIIDVNEAGTSIMTTNKLRIDAGEKTTHTAATPPTLTDTALAKGAEITIDMDQVGSTVAGAGYKVYLVGFITGF